jgi:dephospho-CoA kinase
VFKIGITGGIGSGKTSVCKVFGVLGIPVFSSDTAGREIMDIDTGIILKLNSIAGKNLYPGGTLDRAELARLIFNNPYMLEKVNSVVHPAVFSRFSEWEKKQHAPYVIMEAAIFFENGGSKKVNRVITVTAPVEERIARVMRRNNLTKEQVMERIRNQMSDADMAKQSDYVIDNSENTMIIPTVLNIHEDILKSANQFC